MSDDISTRSCLVYDYGNNVSLALRLAREFGTVFYFKPWKDTNPETMKLVVGDGFNEIHRVRDFWSVLDKVDLFVFADIYDGDLQVYLESLGKRVWGSRMAEDYEYRRELFNDTLEELDMAVAPYQICVGTTALRDYLATHDDQWIKLSLRGDGETWNHVNIALSESKLLAIEYHFGAVKEHVRFTVCETIPTSTEAAYDGFMVTGPQGQVQFSNFGFLGYEDKNQSHILTAIPNDDFPDAVKEVNEKFGPKLAERNFRSAWGTEIKIGDDGKNYFLDATCRQPCPPGHIVQEMVKNLGAFLWHGSVGECIPLEIEKPFGVEIMLYSSWAKTNWQAVDFPEKERRWLKLFNCVQVEGIINVVPTESLSPYSEGSDEIGSVVGLGDTIEEAIEQAKEHLEIVQGFDVTGATESLMECLKRIHDGEGEGIKFGKQPVPEPASVMEDEK